MARSAPLYGRIAINGDSYSKGLNATNYETTAYRALLLDSLQALNAGNGADLWLRGSDTGATVSGAANNPIGFFVAAQPALIIMALGQNDTNTATWDQATFEANVQTCLDHVLNQAACQCCVVSIPYQPSWAGSNPTRQGYAEAGNAILRAEAEARGFHYLPSWDDAQTEAGISQSGDVVSGIASAEDNYHPNNIGHAQLHAAIWADLAPLVAHCLRRGVNSRSAAGSRDAAGARTAA